MAKTRHNNLLNTIDELFTNAKNKGVMHLSTDEGSFSGRKLMVEGKELINFGTLGYLGLDQHPLLKQAGINAIEKYGMQFSASRAYISLHIHQELENKLSAIFEKPTLVSSTSTSLGHLGVIPSIIGDEDAIILDHHVHASIQNAVKLVQVRGVPVEIIRHNNLEMLLETIKKLGQSYRKIWYMIDGVFSMYGDLPPIRELVKLLDEYEQLHLYVDDAHGISWAGKHGRGYTLSQIEYHPKLVLTATMGKAFGSAGGMFTFWDEEIARRVKTFGGALSFSVPAPPPVLAASLASAHIHLSDEITVMQNELSERIEYCNQLISSTKLPLYARNECPIFFIEVGKPAVGYNLVRRMMDEGYFVNLAIFPAVPVRNTGIRFSISRNVEMKDIKGMIEAMDYHYPRVLEEQNKPSLIKPATLITEKEDTSELNLVLEESIHNISKDVWDKLFPDKGFFDWDSMAFVEKVFQSNERPEYNWKFYYAIVYDSVDKEPVAATVYTSALWKEDMLAQSSVSKQIEEKRKDDFYYLTSNVVTLGTFISEGQHLYVNQQHNSWRKAMTLILNQIETTSVANKTSGVILRDFEEKNDELKDFFISVGYVKVDMPESCVIENMDWNTEKEYLDSLSFNSKKHTKSDVIKYKEYYDVEIVNDLDEDELEWAYKLLMDVKNNNFDLNTFTYPKKLFQLMLGTKEFEVLVLRLKPEFDNRSNKKPVAYIFSYKANPKVYCPIAIGMDYDYLKQYNIYRQALYRVIMRAKELGSTKINLGLSAIIEKKKLGAQIVPKVAYVQMKDNFNLEMIGQIMVKNG